MEREKMIEEMTKNGLCCIACEMCDETEENGKFVKAECLESGCTNNCSISKHVAEAFIDAGYRKVPDGAVVLTREEYDKLTSYISEERAKEIFYEETKKLREQTRKETAQKIYNEIKSKRYVGIFIEPFMINYSTVVKVCEKYGANTKEVDE